MKRMLKRIISVIITIVICLQPLSAVAEETSIIEPSENVVNATEHIGDFTFEDNLTGQSEEIIDDDLSIEDLDNSYENNTEDETVSKDDIPVVNEDDNSAFIENIEVVDN